MLKLLPKIIGQTEEKWPPNRLGLRVFGHLRHLRAC
jgi:hypothetical protein